ncbi:MAG: DUF1573 domain-containing protein [Anaerohalosphaeraceae bacterium]|nr:DUF1573 domain-containing protein [Anaerohalosphaeraceae bacterium]
MKVVNFLTVGILCLVLCVFTGCETASPNRPAVTTAPAVDLAVSAKPVASAVAISAAKIVFENPVHDFGQVAPGSYSNCVFKFTNTGTEVLKITRTKGTCKCTVPGLKKKNYAPGESGQITLKFHAPKYRGSSTQRIYVSSNDPQTPKFELTIRANVKTYVKADPESIQLSLIDPAAGDITLASVDGEMFAITKIDSFKNVIKVDYDPKNIAAKHTLHTNVNANLLRKHLVGYILMEVNHPKCKDIRIQYRCLKEFEASPSAIILRNATAGKSEKREIYLTSNYNQEIVIESAKSEKGIIEVLSQKETENRFEFEVEITPPDKSSKLRYFSDTLHIKIKDKEQIDIPCRGFYSI